jgi:hypothetical protein
LIPKIGGTTQIQAYPPAPMTGYVTNVQNASYGTGYYIASASTELSVLYLAWYGFDKTNGSGPNIWASATQYSGSNYVGSVNTIDIYGNVYPGEWLQLKLPIPIVLYNYTLQCQAASIINICTIFYILGSKDGINWVCINFQTGQSWTVNAQLNSYTIQNNQYAFNYYRIIAKQLNGGVTFAIGELILYGIEESINITADGQVGLGITNPVQQLEVAGNAIINGNISANNIGLFRNRIINGGMTINQRGITSSNLATGTAAVYFMDRFAVEYSITTGALTLSNVSLSTSDTPYQYGFQNSFRVIASTACSSYAYILPKTNIEGYNIADFNWATSFATPITTSFWLRTSLSSGNICLNIRNDAISSSYNTNINVVGSNVWQYVNTTIPPPPTGSAWNITNGRGIYLSIGGYQSGALQSSSNTWVNANNLGTSTTTNLWATVNNFVEFTGLQLEKGTIATPFEYRPYQTELQLCQRYCQVLNAYTGQIYAGPGFCSSVYGTSSNLLNTSISLPVPLRVPPTSITFNNVINQYIYGFNTGGNASNLIIGVPTGGQNITNFELLSYFPGIALNTGSNTTVGLFGFLVINANGYINFSAEL